MVTTAAVGEVINYCRHRIVLGGAHSSIDTRDAIVVSPDHCLRITSAASCAAFF